MTQPPVSTARSEPARVEGWARVYPAIHPAVAKSLRRGAWYEVLKNDQPDRAAIRMGSRIVTVPRRVVEIRPARPAYFSVVNRVEYDREPGRKSQYNLGKLYIVCPACAHRVALRGRPEKTQCPQCRHEGEVGWWEA